MLLLRSIFLSFFILLCASGLSAQSGFAMQKGNKVVEIPFEYYNNFILLKVTFNRVFPLVFILDTGAEYTVLCKREISDLMQVPYDREFKIAGSDLSSDLVAYLARGIRFDIGDKLTAPGEDILVLADDYFKFEEYIGANVHGIMTANVFAGYIMKIDYQRAVITLYKRDFFRTPKDYTEGKLEIYRNKPYINTSLQVLRDTLVPVKLLIDTGAALPLLLFSDSHPLLNPPARSIPSQIGMGLGGYIEGFVGRIFQVQIGPVYQNAVVSYFQKLDSLLHQPYLNNRNGLIGNGVLARFSIILDYQTAKIWLKPIKKHNQAFIFDRSGIHIIATGVSLHTFVIQNILPDSPAAEADIRKGDEIVAIGVAPASLFSLDDIQRRLQKKSGKVIKMTIRRDGKRLKKSIKLRDIL
jgi:hypothetical protein